jgi:hypothetical protein
MIWWTFPRNCRDGTSLRDQYDRANRIVSDLQLCRRAAQACLEKYHKTGESLPLVINLIAYTIESLHENLRENIAESLAFVITEENVAWVGYRVRDNWDTRNILASKRLSILGSNSLNMPPFYRKPSERYSSQHDVAWMLVDEDVTRSVRVKSLSEEDLLYESRRIVDALRSSRWDIEEYLKESEKNLLSQDEEISLPLKSLKQNTVISIPLRKFSGTPSLYPDIRRNLKLMTLYSAGKYLWVGHNVISADKASRKLLEAYPEYYHLCGSPHIDIPPIFHEGENNRYQVNDNAVWQSISIEEISQNIAALIKEPEEIENFLNLPRLSRRKYLYSLHQAMLCDGSGELRRLLERFIVEVDSDTRRTLLNQIMLKWSAVSDFYDSPWSDWTGFMDKFYGEALGIRNPSSEGWKQLRVDYEKLVLYFYDRLSRQIENHAP